MATMLHSDSKRLYSWWWDSHISPKNSKWLQENLTDMDTKVKAMIKLIEEDADSFARRAEMYYKKRPELMKLVEEFYRAYRALAERYDHATVELRHAHKTMAEAFPNQLPFDMTDDSASASSEPRTPDKPPRLQPFFDPEELKDSLRISRRNSGCSEDSHCGGSKRGLKQLNELLGSDAQVEDLKKTLTELLAEKEALHLHYQLNLSRLSSLETELNNAQNVAGGLDERASKAEIEIKILREALAKLEAERDSGLLQYNQSMERISNLKASVSQAQEDAKGLNDRASKAEIEAQHLKVELSRLHAEKEAAFVRYKQCLGMISVLEDKIKAIEESAQMFNEQTERAETEIEALKQELLKLQEEKEDVNLRYQQCLETIAKLEGKIVCVQEDAKRLSCEVKAGAEKLKSVEDQCAFLETSNQSLQLEADNLAQQIAVKDQELFEKQNELEKVQTLLQDEHFQFEQLEASLKNLQNLLSQSQEEQKMLTLELQNKVQMLRDLEIRNQNFEDEISQVEEENRTLNELNSSSSISLQIQLNEIFSLKEMKEKLEGEVARQVDQSNVLQEDVCRLKEEIDDLSKRYLMLREQVELAGLNPESIVSSVKELKEVNSTLIELCNNQRDERNAFSEKQKEMDEALQKNVLLESSLLESKMKLMGSREKVKDLQEQCESLRGEKSGLVAERVNVLSQLQIMTENMQKLLEKNTSLENSLSSANIELEGLREKSKCFGEFFQMLKNEKSELLKDREGLICQLNRVEERLGILEKRFSTLEGKYSDLEKEKQFTHIQVEELRVSLVAEKQERATYVQSSEFRLAELQNHVNLLQEECRSRKKEFEEELDRAVKAQVEIFILQKFIEDLEQKNFSLLIECQKCVEASKLSENFISELESENLEQQMEAEFLLDEIENLRDGIYQVLKALQVDTDHKINKEQIQIPCILGEIDELKCSLSSSEDEKQRLVIENSMLLSLLGQFRLDGSELEAEKNITEKNLDIMMHQYEMLQKENHELMEINELLKSEVINRDRIEKVLRVELKTEHEKLGSVQEAYVVLQREYSNALDKNKSLLKKFFQLKNEMLLLEEENSVILQETVFLSNMSLVYRCFVSEKSEEVEAFAENLNSLQEINTSLKQKVKTLEEKLNMKEVERQKLYEKLVKLDEELTDANETNAQLRHEILVGDEILREKAKDLVEAEQMLKAAHNMNAELCKAVEEVKKECEESKLVGENLEKQNSELFGLNGKQKMEIEHLGDLNKNLESEVELLHKEIQEQQVREEYLSFELQEKSNEFGIWDAEATSFYFDLQISAVREVLLENKVHELTGVCENLKDESAVKSTEIEEMKEKVGSLENEIGDLKSQLSAYVPVLASLRQDVESLEQTAEFWTTHQQERNEHHGNQKIATACQELEENRKPAAKDEILHLQELRTRIRAIERAVLEERDRLALQKSSITSTGVRRSLDKGKDHRKEQEIEINNDVSCEIRQPNIKPRCSEVKNGLLMKDIPLDQVSDSSFYVRSRDQSRGSNDQMLELWEESAEQDSTMINGYTKKKENALVGRKSQNPSLELQAERELGIVDKLELSRSIEDKAKILERLVFDSRKLASLRTTLRELKKKMEMDERHSRTHNPDHEKVKRELKEAEEAILRLVNTNETLSKDIEETGDARDIYRKRVLEQSRNVSEKTEQLQFDVQNIERLMLKLDDGAKTKGRKKFSESRTVILLRDIIHKSGKRTGRKKKNRFCGCMRSSTREE